MREARASSIKPGTNGERSPAESVQSHAGVRVERLYEDYAGRVYRYCLSRLGSPEEAEDALQATYLNAWRSLSSGVEPISTRPWLFQIASNVCSSMLRTRLGGAREELRSPETFDQIPTEVGSTDELLGLSAALEELPVRQRQALLLRDWRGLSYDEIAAEMNSSYEAVETLLFRARRSVAAGLRQPEPTAVPARARALAPLPFMIPLKDGFSAFKSAFSGSVAPIKVSLGIALGAAAPLVAYGLLERGVADHPAAQPAAAQALQIDTPVTFAAPLPDREKLIRSAAPILGATQKTHSGSSSHDPAGGAAAAADAGADPPGQASGDGDPVASPPDPASPPPPDPATSRVAICHQTSSKKNPTVTITVAEAAVEVFLAQGDKLGACVG